MGCAASLSDVITQFGGGISEQLAGRDLAWLERRRAGLFGLVSQVGDFRRGALNAVWRKCGKPNCACAQPGHRGHGPQWNLTRRIGGKTVNVHLKRGPELEKAQREVAEHQRFACAGRELDYRLDLGTLTPP